MAALSKVSFEIQILLVHCCIWISCCYETVNNSCAYQYINAAKNVLSSQQNGINNACKFQRTIVAYVIIVYGLNLMKYIDSSCRDYPLIQIMYQVKNEYDHFISITSIWCWLLLFLQHKERLVWSLRRVSDVNAIMGVCIKG